MRSPDVENKTVDRRIGIVAGAAVHLEWVSTPHCTLAHSLDPTNGAPAAVIALGAALTEQRIAVTADAVFVRKDGNLAALRVTSVCVVGSGGKGGVALAQAFADKAFVHVTLWVGAGASAVESNPSAVFVVVVFFCLF
eukprot:COSAG05_NODE_923_length_6573_cov_168.011725_11_plen_138_part_00